MKQETGEAEPCIDSAYLLNNAAGQAPARFDALSTLYDRSTIQYLEGTGVGPGWRCLEVGGGGGSIAAWLATRVGPTGHVLATDLDPRFLDRLQAPNMEVRRHNIATEPLPVTDFDLIHARLVLVHLPEPEKVLERLVAALKPGGYLVDEEFDSASLHSDPVVSPGEILLKSQIAQFQVVEARGIDRGLGRLLYGHLRVLGLVEVYAEARLSMWQGGSVGASLLRANFEQLRDPFIAGGYVTERELQQDLAQLDSPDFMMPSPIMWTAWGRRPLAL